MCLLKCKYKFIDSYLMSDTMLWLDIEYLTENYNKFRFSLVLPNRNDDGIN